MRCLIFAAGLAAPLSAFAHGGDHTEHWWSLDPWTWVPLLLIVALYARGLLRVRAKGGRSAGMQAAWFSGAVATLFLALIWPLDVLSGVSFAAHMTQHMLLIVAAAPLFVHARPGPLIVAGMPSPLRRLNRYMGPVYGAVHRIALPGPAFVLHGLIVWIWHAPYFFELALDSDAIHFAEHASFFASALLFWYALQQACRPDGRGYGAAVLWILATLMHTGLLGALLTFSPRLLYPYYLSVEHAPFDALEDQQLAGLIMWVPGGLCYLLAGLGVAASFLRASARKDEARAA